MIDLIVVFTWKPWQPCVGPDGQCTLQGWTPRPAGMEGFPALPNPVGREGSSPRSAKMITTAGKLQGKIKVTFSNSIFDRYQWPISPLHKRRYCWTHVFSNFSEFFPMNPKYEQRFSSNSWDIWLEDLLCTPIRLIYKGLQASYLMIDNTSIQLIFKYLNIN